MLERRKAVQSSLRRIRLDKWIGRQRMKSLYLLMLGVFLGEGDGGVVTFIMLERQLSSSMSSDKVSES